MKRIISLLLVFALLLPCMGLQAEAATSGSCGKNVTWKFDTKTGTLTISGSGPMDNFGFDEAPWSGYWNKIRSVDIRKGVTSIGSNAFVLCSVTSATIPDGVTSIGDAAFAESNLASTTIPNSVRSIGNSAFSYCALTSVTIPKNVTSIGKYAFQGCDLTSVTIPDGITSIREGTFRYCKELTSVTIPDSVTSIGKYAFSDCRNLKNVYYGGSPVRKDSIKIGSSNTELIKATWHYDAEDSLCPPTVWIAPNAATGKPRLSWKAVEGADFYRIYRAASPNGTYSYLKSTHSVAFTDTSAVTGENYYYKVKAVEEESGSVSGFSNVVNRCCDLPQPVVFTTVNGATGKPMLTWDAIDGAQCYRIYRRTSGSDYTYLDSTTSTTFTDKTAEAGINYYYQVKAVHKNSAANSARSLTANRACDLPRPVVTVGLKNGNPQITWEKISGAEKYRVYRADSKTGEYELVKSTITASSFTDTGAEEGKTYYYKVRALHSNPASNSAWSAVKSVTAK